MASAGIATAAAWEKSSAGLHGAGPPILALLQKGLSLSQAMGRYGLLTPAQQVFLSAADDAGCLPAALLRLASESEQSSQRQQEMKSKWGVLYLLLAIGWLAGSISAGAAEPARLVSILLLNSGKCLLTYYLIQLVSNLSLQSAWWWLGMAWKFHWRRQAYQWSFTMHWLDLLGWQLAAGVDAATALKSMQGLISTPAYKHATAQAAIAVQNGQSLSTALASNGLLTNTALEQILVSAEASGKIGESLEHQAQLAAPNLKLYVDSVMFWLSKVLYALVGAVAFSMLYFR
jgi:type II secretory pathway component PulF